MQERATSSHEQYDRLIDEVENCDVIEGVGHLMRQIAAAMRIYAKSLLVNETYEHPFSLTLTVKAVKNLLDEANENNETHPSTLFLLMKNLTHLEQILREADKADKAEQDIEPSDLYFHYQENEPLSTILKSEHPHFRFAVRLTLCLLLGYSIMHLFQIEKGAWILLTSLIVCQQTYGATRQRLFHRISGTLLGVFFGAALAHLLPTTTGQLLIYLGTIYALFFFLKKNYVVAVIFVTIYVSAAYNLLSGEGVDVLIPRVIDTIIGGFLAYAVVRFMWPDWQYKQLPSLLLSAIEKNRRFFKSIYKKSTTESHYLEHRLSANKADNALASSWKDMRLEPKSKRYYQQKAFRLTDLNHVLLSYISAFGVHYRNPKDQLDDEQVHFCEYVTQTLQHVTQMISQHTDEEMTEKYIAQAHEREEEIARYIEENDNQGAVLIQNIARVARQLMVETSGLRELYQNENEEK